MRVGVDEIPLPLPEKDPVPIVQAGWASGPVWTGAENLAPHRQPAASRNTMTLFLATELRQ